MKIRALILFFPFTVFLAETAFMPAASNTCKKENISCRQTSCMKMKQSPCQSKKEHNKKPPGKCNNTSECSSCPVCFTFTFLPQYEWSARSFSFKKNYWLINTGHISSYIPPVWKPPNGYSFYS
jgi:hypothetical protein